MVKLSDCSFCLVPFVGPFLALHEAHEIDRKVQAISKEARAQTEPEKAQIAACKKRITHLCAEILLSAGFTITLLIGIAAAQIFPLLAALACMGYIYAGASIGQIEARLAKEGLIPSL